jgi:membrane protein implicated in regulation of membrane protease activity
MNLDHFIYGALFVLAIWLILAVLGVLLVRRWAEKTPEEPRYVRDVREAAGR